MPSLLIIWSIFFVSSFCFSLNLSCSSLFLLCPLLAMVGCLSMFQATAPVSIPVCPELAGLGSGNGTGPGTGTGNAISVSWQSPHIIFKGALVSEALSHAFLKKTELLSCCFFSCRDLSILLLWLFTLCFLMPSSFHVEASVLLYKAQFMCKCYLKCANVQLWTSVANIILCNVSLLLMWIKSNEIKTKVNPEEYF